MEEIRKKLEELGFIETGTQWFEKTYNNGECLIDVSTYYFNNSIKASVWCGEVQIIEKVSIDWLKQFDALFSETNKQFNEK